MPSPAFGPFFEIFSEGVVMTVALITTAAFAERCLKRSAPLNITGLGASAIALFYSTYGLTYWFNGIEGYDCTTLAAVNGTCMSASNALTYLHLFVKADASNRSNPSWRKYFRWVGVGTTLFNWATLIAVHALLTGTEVNGIDGPRCRFMFEMVTFKLKWIAQFINQAFQVAAFVWPLIGHLRMMKSGAQKIDKRDSVFGTLVIRALIASGVSLLFTVIATALAFAKIREIDQGTNDLNIPLFPLAVLDNAVSLGAIFFAIHINCRPAIEGSSRMGGSRSVQDSTTSTSGTSAGNTAFSAARHQSAPLSASVASSVPHDCDRLEAGQQV